MKIERGVTLTCYADAADKQNQEAKSRNHDESKSVQSDRTDRKRLTVSHNSQIRPDTKTKIDTLSKNWKTAKNNSCLTLCTTNKSNRTISVRGIG